MNNSSLDNKYKKRKDFFHKYIHSVKKNITVDIFSVINTTLISNPYSTDFPKLFFIKKIKKEKRFYQFIKNSMKFYIQQLLSFILYASSFIIYKTFYKKRTLKLKNYIIIDTFFLVDKIVDNKKFTDNYFNGLYEVLDKYNKDYIFLPRLFGVGKNPFRLVNFFKIINSDKRNFLFEFELLSVKDLLSIFYIVMLYPFKTLRLIKEEEIEEDILFNNELVKDIGNLPFDSISRYILGKNIAKLKNINKIYSWSEFQVIERSFNYAIRTNNSNIRLIGCQFYNNFETYFNSYLEDIDFVQKTSSHEVLVNGKHYLLNREKIAYNLGVSLRYKNIFSFDIFPKGNEVVLLGSYLEETKYMLECVSEFEKVVFKCHPIVNIKQLGKLNTNIHLVDTNIYNLFKKSSIIISMSSGTIVEAVACCVSVIILAKENDLTANMLTEYGKGKIWDITNNKNDIKMIYNNLSEYRKNNIDEIKQIASWYKDNFYVEPTEENIVKVFELERKI